MQEEQEQYIERVAGELLPVTSAGGNLAPFTPLQDFQLQENRLRQL